MQTIDWSMASVLLLCLVAIVGFFYTKTKGFGRFATSTLLLLVALSIAATLYAANRLADQVFVNILFAIVGFAGGIFTGKDADN